MMRWRPAEEIDKVRNHKKKKNIFFLDQNESCDKKTVHLKVTL